MTHAEALRLRVRFKVGEPLTDDEIERLLDAVCAHLVCGVCHEELDSEEDDVE